MRRCLQCRRCTKNIGGGMMFEVIEGGKKTLLENLQEQARLKKS